MEQRIRSRVWKSEDHKRCGVRVVAKSRHLEIWKSSGANKVLPKRVWCEIHRQHEKPKKDPRGIFEGLFRHWHTACWLQLDWEH